MSDDAERKDQWQPPERYEELVPGDPSRGYVKLVSVTYRDPMRPTYVPANGQHTAFPPFNVSPAGTSEVTTREGLERPVGLVLARSGSSLDRLLLRHQPESKGNHP